MPTTNRLAALRLQLVATEMSLRVGKRIRQRRLELGIRTQRELADKIPSDSVTNQTINKWETGANEPGPRYKTMLAEALHVDVAYFIAEDPKGETPDLFGTPAVEGALADRLDAIDAAIEALRHERAQEADRVRELLKAQDALLERQSRILTRIEAAIATEDDSAERLEEAVRAAGRILRAETQDPPAADPKPAPSRKKRASTRAPA